MERWMVARELIARFRCSCRLTFEEKGAAEEHAYLKDHWVWDRQGLSEFGFRKWVTHE